MKLTTIIALGFIVLLAGCKAQDMKPILDNLSHDCDRHYTFSASTGGGVTGAGGSVTIAGTADCKHEFTPGAVPVPAPPPGQ